MGEMTMLVDGIIGMVFLIGVFLFLAYIVNMYLNKRELVRMAEREKAYEESQKFYCLFCGKLNRRDFVYCQHCGKKLHEI